MISIATDLFAAVVAPFILALFLACGGSAQTGDTMQARVGQEFQIKVGQRIKLVGEDLEVGFTGVPEDSRCPVDVNCVWAGNAQVTLDLLQDKCTSIVTLNTHQRSQAAEEGKVKGYLLKLVTLEPSPRSDHKTAASDYVATLLITRQ
jgi:hypothetical protein